MRDDPSLTLKNKIPEYGDYVDPEDLAELLRLRNGRLEIMVSDERAVDSYNARFDCSIILTPEQAAELRDWLASKFPKTGE